MGRIIAIDYGTKRCGIAATDPLKMIASGVTTVHSSEILKWLEEYLRKEEVETIVVGDPRDLKGQKTDATFHADGFVTQLRKKFPGIHIARVDERFTSKIASRTLLESGLKKKDRQNKELIDEVSATLLLQSYMGH